MKRYVAVLTTVLLLALAAAAQTPSGAGVSAQGRCGPGQPYVESFLGPPVGDPLPGTSGPSRYTVEARTRRSDLVMVGRAATAASVAGSSGVWTVATFSYPLVLKSPPGGPASGVAKVTIRFLGGTALFHGVCTEQSGRSRIWPGTLYLVFGWTEAHLWNGARFTGEASPVSDATGLLTLLSGPRIYWPAGRPHTLATAVAYIRAEVAREKVAAGGPKR